MGEGLTMKDFISAILFFLGVVLVTGLEAPNLSILQILGQGVVGIASIYLAVKVSNLKI